MIDRISFWLIVIGLLLVQNTNAQDELFIEINGGASFTNDEPVREVDLKTGIALEGLIHYRVLNNIAIFGGWGWTRFPSEEVILNSINIGQATFREVGYRIGFEFNKTVLDNRYGLYIRPGALYSQIQAETEDATLEGESDYTFDWQVALGLTAQVNSRIQLRPGFRYHYINRELEYKTLLEPTDVNVTYFTITLGALVTLF